MYRHLKMLLIPAFLGLTFVLSSLILNGIQLLCYLFIKPLNKDLFRRINYYLIYSSWSQVVAIAEWWSKSELIIYSTDETFKHFGKEHAMVIMNHKYEVDWLYTWMVCDKLGNLGGAKSFAKSSLKKLPIIGWAWIFAEMIFLERNWEKDSRMLHNHLDEIMSYTDTSCFILLFAEGTRFTPEKHQASLEFAKLKNLPELKYHLLPRTKGFVYCIKHLKGKMEALYDVELVFKDKPKPSVVNVMRGQKLVGHMYVNRIPLDDIPTDSDEECAKWLYELYEKKDKLTEEFIKTGTFPEKIQVMPYRYWGPLNWLCWAAAVGLPFIFFLWRMFISGNIIGMFVATALLATVLAGLIFFLNATRASKGSSYGKVSPQNGQPPSSKESDETHHVVNGQTANESAH